MLWIISLVLLTAIACSDEKDEDYETYWPTGSVENCDKVNPLHIPDCDGDIVEAEKVFIKDGKKWLWGGLDFQHFDISNWCLNECQLHYGLGREAFHALIEPQYISARAANSFYSDDDRFIIVIGQNEQRAYPISLLIKHEVINDEIDGEPYMAVYCILANLGTVYKRTFCGKELTFGVSGYTYFDQKVWNGLDAFIIWDRETESLWWPLLDKAVSGEMKGVQLEKFVEGVQWKDTNWGYIFEKYPDCVVLEDGQVMLVPNVAPLATVCN